MNDREQLLEIVRSADQQELASIAEQLKLFLQQFEKS